MLGQRVRIVLVRPRHAGNVGAAARAMKNMGLGRLVVVDPYRFDLARAARMAVHARDVVGACRIVGSLADAVGDCGLVVGTTSRSSARERGAITPRAAAPEIVAAVARNDVALVFGPENHGLSNAELAVCQRVVRIPASAAYASINVAQAVLLCAYEIFLAAGDPTDDVPGEAGPRASSGRLEFMYARIEDALRAIGFLHPGNVTHMMGRVRRLLDRTAPGEADVQVLLGVVRQARWAAERAGLVPSAGEGKPGHLPADDGGAAVPRSVETTWARS
jgi:TrmH family RNA methyltransferase